MSKIALKQVNEGPFTGCFYISAYKGYVCQDGKLRRSCITGKYLYPYTDDVDAILNDQFCGFFTLQDKAEEVLYKFVNDEKMIKRQAYEAYKRGDSLTTEQFLEELNKEYKERYVRQEEPTTDSPTK